MKNPPAFPRPSSSSSSAPLTEQFDPQSGMTLRDYFAAKALQGMCANPSIRTDGTTLDISKHAFNFADAMLEERNK